MAQTITLGKVSVSPKGAYSSATSYTFLDTVSHNGGSFLCLQNARGIQPGVTAGWENYWMVTGQGIKSVNITSPASGKVKFTVTLSNGAESSITIDTAAIADGSIGTNELADGSMTTPKIAPGAVTRAKLARDALYSPINSTGAETSYEITASDLGKTIAPSSAATSLDVLYTLSHDVASSFPYGGEIAILRRYGNSLKIKFGENVHSAIVGDTYFRSNRTYEIPERFGMVALKRVDYGSSSGVDYWVVTGNVEVVE